MLVQIAAKAFTLRKVEEGRAGDTPLVPSLFDILSARKGLKPASERAIRVLEVPPPPRTFLDDIRSQSYTLKSAQ